MKKITAWLKAVLVFALIILIGASILLSPFGILLGIGTVLAIPLKFMRHYIQQVWESVDQTINAVGLGNMDHTISGRVGRAAVEGNPVGLAMEKVINTLLWFDPDHCRQAIEHDEPKKVYR